MTCRAGLLLLSLMSTSAHAQEVAENPWLREHFTISFKSRESFRVLDRIAEDEPIRKAVWDYPFSQMIRKMSPGLPEDVRYTRTFLRCMDLGWVYGGHWLDVISMTDVDFEGMLAEKGHLLEALDVPDVLTVSKENLFILSDADRAAVAVLSVPGGFEGETQEIRDFLLRSLQTPDEIPADADWTVSFKPKRLLDKAVWDAIPPAIATASQKRDVESDGEGSLRLMTGSLLTNSIQSFASDVERFQLSAFLTRKIVLARFVCRWRSGLIPVWPPSLKRPQEIKFARHSILITLLPCLSLEWSRFGQTKTPFNVSKGCSNRRGAMCRRQGSLTLFLG